LEKRGYIVKGFDRSIDLPHLESFEFRLTHSPFMFGRKYDRNSQIYSQILDDALRGDWKRSRVAALIVVSTMTFSIL
jgi:hypothetical protein